MDDLLTAAQAADLLHLHVKRVQALARDGKLPAVRYGRKWLFPRARLLGAAGGAEPRPIAAPAAGVEISARNQLRGRITAMTVDGVMAEVRIAIGDQELVSIITRSSAERLGLRVGAPVLAVIKSTEVMIGVGRGEGRGARNEGRGKREEGRGKRAEGRGERSS
jgi:molybdopterin-binding protein